MEEVIHAYKEQIGREPYQPLSSLLNKLQTCISKYSKSEDATLAVSKQELTEKPVITLLQLREAGVTHSSNFSVI